MAITLYDAYGRPVQKNVLSQEIARPSMTGVRSIWNHGYVTGGLTPQRLASLLQKAAEGDADAYLSLAEEMEEKDPHYASVLGTRKRAVARLPIVVEAASDSPLDIKLADEVRALLKRRGVKGMLEEQLDALGKGYSVNEIMWDKSTSPWQPARYEWRDPRFFQFDHETLRELRLKDEADLMNGLPLPAYKFMIHTPRLKCGIPLRGGLARLAAWTYIFKNYTVKDWLAFCEVFGMPLRLGKYRPGETEDNINILKSAVANLGSDAAAVIPEGMMIEFIENSKGTGGEGLFERLANWLDKQMSKAILGQTMTADDGSSQAQAKVHDEVREDIRDADAEQLAETLERDLVIPYICLNHGPQKAYPAVYLREPGQTDITIMSEALAKLVPLGLKVEASEVRDRLGFSDPAKDAECLGQPTTPQPPPKLGGGAEGGGGKTATNHETTCPHCTALNAEGEVLPDQVDLVAQKALEVEDGSYLIQEIRQMIADAGSLELAASAYLRDTSGQLNIWPFASALASAQLLANLTGRDEIMTDLALNAEAQPISLPFEEAIQFFRQKLGMKSETWSAIYASEHDHAFTVAGVMRDDMLSDFRLAIDTAIAEGTTYQTFLGDFDTIVARYGWSYNGSRGWRSRTIYETNIRASYQAGRYAQMTDPDVLKYRPNWMYQHGDSIRPRQMHLGWHGTVLPADDPWWESHYTPNGWGCKCRVTALSNRDLARLDKKVGTAPNDGTFEWVNPATGEVRDIPRGIDPGWDYNPGKQWLNPKTGKLEDKG
jgi:phage gp29-like protein